MSQPEPGPGGELLELAVPYALDAVSDAERAEIDRQVAAAPKLVAEGFRREVRSTGETMAELSVVTAVEPPGHVRDRIFAKVVAQRSRSLRLRYGLIAAAAAVLIAVASVGVTILIRPAQPQATTAQILSASDVRTVSGVIPTGGSATVLFSPGLHEAVLVMNNVAPPKPGTVYQMWLVGPGGAVSAGTMDEHAVSPSTTAVIKGLGDSTTLAFTVEPAGGSPAPTGEIFAKLPLS